MNSTPEGGYISFVLHVRHEIRGDAFRGEIVMSDGRRVGLADGSYRVRVWLGPNEEWVRGTISNDATKKTVSFQSGDRVAEFIRDCLDEISVPDAPSPGDSPSG